MSTPCELVTVVQRHGQRGVMWDGTCGASTLHAARWDVGEPLAPDDKTPAGIDYDDQPAVGCDRCGEPVPWDAPDVPCRCGDSDCTEMSSPLSRFGGQRIVYSTASGKLEPGSMYWTDHTDMHECFHWDNCDGRHLHVVLPNGHPWDIDSRANNCTLPDNRTHRCWVREGEPPNVTAGKAGDTCSAGAGSILSGSYHGFLQGGVLT